MPCRRRLRWAWLEVSMGVDMRHEAAHLHAGAVAGVIGNDYEASEPDKHMASISVGDRPLVRDGYDPPSISSCGLGPENYENLGTVSTSPIHRPNSGSTGGLTAPGINLLECSIRYPSAVSPAIVGLHDSQ